MGAYDFMGQRESETRSGRLCSEKWIENSLAVFRRDADTVIADADFQRAMDATVDGIARRALDCEPHLAAVRHRLFCIGHEIEQRLGQQPSVAPKRRQLRLEIDRKRPSLGSECRG